VTTVGESHSSSQRGKMRSSGLGWRDSIQPVDHAAQVEGGGGAFGTLSANWTRATIGWAKAG